LSCAKVAEENKIANENAIYLKFLFMYINLQFLKCVW
jgi:hypothetical protein